MDSGNTGEIYGGVHGRNRYGYKMEKILEKEWKYSKFIYVVIVF